LCKIPISKRNKNKLEKDESNSPDRYICLYWIAFLLPEQGKIQDSFLGGRAFEFSVAKLNTSSITLTMVR
jgi:hypothetical protein